MRRAARADGRLRLRRLGLTSARRCAVREQVDWDLVRRRTDGSPYAAAFMTLVERLGVVSAPVTSALSV